MNGLSELPCCPIWRLDGALPKGTNSHLSEGREDGSEISLVTDDRIGGIWADRERRGVASIGPSDDEATIEWGTTQREWIAALGRALKRLGWTGAPTLAMHVYGSAS